MQYQVLARKWRPQSFSDLVGQDHVSRTLQNALESGRVAHAFLFSGPRGSGKTSTARILAKALNCHAGRPGEPCGVCPACTEIASGNCMDVLEIDAASNTGVDNIRDLIERAQYAPARDRNRIFIIDEVHMLSNAAFNALLKTLEEPPGHVVFILATTEYHKIPATILSRCQNYSFKLIPFPLILDRLRRIAEAEKIDISTGALEQVTFSSGGSMRDAMSALDQVIAFSGQTVRDDDVTVLLGLIEPSLLARTTRAVASNDGNTLLQVAAELVDSGQDLQNFCRRFLAHLRNLMVLKAGVTDPAVLGVPESLLPDLRKQSELFSRVDLLRLFDAFLRIDGDVRHSMQPRFQLEMGMIELAHVARLRDLETVIEELRRASEEVAQQGTPPPSAASGGQPGRIAPPSRTGRSSSEMAGSSAERGSTGSSSAGAPANDLLARIVTRLQRPALASVLDGLPGAELRGDTMMLDLGSASEFVRRQIQDNLAVLGRAASDVVGRPVRVAIADREVGATPSADRNSESQNAGDILAIARREPVVQSFLDVFPGPVKAEEVDS